MHIVHVDQVPETGSPKVRGGSGHTSQVMFDSDVLGRDPERADNFFMQVSHLEPGQFHSPRHRHNFEQIRFMIEGEGDYPEGKMTGGTLGYFPEGAFYGPQQNMFGSIVILQFGGPSGSGFVDRKQMKRAFEEMKQLNTGYFEDGTYFRNPGVEGEGQQDGNEAMIEHVRKRRMVYPQAQYATPILIDTNAFPWNPTDLPGVAEKALGSFSSARIPMARYKLDPGAVFTARGRGAFLVLSGSGTLEGGPFRKMTVLYLEVGEEAAFAAGEESDILQLGLPDIALIAKNPPVNAA
jgi:hypothetical protein